MSQQVFCFLFKKVKRVFGLELEALAGTDGEKFCQSFLSEIKAGTAQFDIKNGRLFFVNSAGERLEFLINKTDAKSLKELFEANVEIKMMTRAKPTRVTIVLKGLLTKSRICTSLRKEPLDMVIVERKKKTPIEPGEELQLVS